MDRSYDVTECPVVLAWRDAFRAWTNGIARKVSPAEEARLWRAADVAGQRAEAAVAKDLGSTSRALSALYAIPDAWFLGTGQYRENPGNDWMDSLPSAKEIRLSSCQQCRAPMGVSGLDDNYGPCVICEEPAYGAVWIGKRGNFVVGCCMQADCINVLKTGGVRVGHDGRVYARHGGPRCPEVHHGR